MLLAEVGFWGRSRSHFFALVLLCTIAAVPLSSAKFLGSLERDCQVLETIPGIVELYSGDPDPGWCCQEEFLVSSKARNREFACNQDRISKVQLDNLKLSGPLPEAIGDLSQLEELSLRFNKFNSSVPSAWGNLKQLKSLRLDHNKLAGPLPPEIGSMEALKDLVLYNNELSGSLPPSIGKLANCQSLLINDNKISGALPATIGDMKNLQVGLLVRRVSVFIEPHNIYTRRL